MSNLELFIHTACAIVVIILAARMTGSLMVRLKQPRVVGEMIAGVLLGPTFFSSVFPQISDYLFKSSLPNIYLLGNIGLSFYMFLVGMEIDLGKLDKAIKKQAVLISVAATAVPFACGCLCAFLYFNKLCLAGIPLSSFMFFTGTAFSIMAFPMLARILDEKNLIKTKLGSLALLSSSIQDVVTWILLAFIIAMASTGSVSNGIITLVGALLFIAVTMLLVKPFLRRYGSKVQSAGSMNQDQFALIMIFLLLAAIITDKVGLYSVFGGFILGLAMPKDPVFQKELKTKLQDIVVVFLLPLFFAFSGLKTNFLLLCSSDLVIPSLLILSLAIASKYLPVLFFMRSCGYSWKEASAIGGLINARGLMELIVANIGLDYKIIDVNMFSIMVLMAVVTTLAAMPIYNLSLKKTDLDLIKKPY